MLLLEEPWQLHFPLLLVLTNLEGEVKGIALKEQRTEVLVAKL